MSLCRARHAFGALLLCAAAGAAAAGETPPGETPPGDQYLGFDTSVYPGNAAMRAWKRSGLYDWVGYYLQAACHKDDSWSGKRGHLVRNGWGLAVIYVGQQTWGRSLASAAPASGNSILHPVSARISRPMTRRSSTSPAASGTSDRCSASFVNAARGRIDARDAIAMARREGFEKGAVIFLDVEHMRTVPRAMRDYYTTWARTLLANGRYRPGIYAHTANAATIYRDVNAVYRKAGMASDPPFWIASTRGFSIHRDPTDVGHDFASVWQGALDVVRSHSGVRLPVDISVAADPSPSAAAVE